jgi:hypothetical protein
MNDLYYKKYLKYKNKYLLLKGGAQITITHKYGEGIGAENTVIVNSIKNINIDKNLEEIIKNLGINMKENQELYLLYKNNINSDYRILDKNSIKNLKNGSIVASFIRPINENENENEDEIAWSATSNGITYASKNSIFSEPYVGEGSLRNLLETHEKLRNFDGKSRKKCLNYYYLKDPTKMNHYSFKDQNKEAEMAIILGINSNIITKGESSNNEKERKGKLSESVNYIENFHNPKLSKLVSTIANNLENSKLTKKERQALKKKRRSLVLNKKKKNNSKNQSKNNSANN